MICLLKMYDYFKFYIGVIKRIRRTRKAVYGKRRQKQENTYCNHASSGEQKGIPKDGKKRNRKIDKEFMDRIRKHGKNRKKD